MMIIRLTSFDWTENEVFEVVQITEVEVDDMQSLMEHPLFGEAINALIEGKMGEFRMMKMERVE